MSELDEVVREFLVESYEGLDALDSDLVALELAPDDRSRLAAIFRCIHTIKGTCGFLGFGKLEKVAHVGETLLALLRDGEIKFTPAIASGLLQMVDAIRQLLGEIESTGSEGANDYADVQAQLAHLTPGANAEEVKEAEADAMFAAARAKRAKEQAAKAAAMAGTGGPAPDPAAAAPPSPPAPTPASSPAAAAAIAPVEADAKNSALSDHNIRVDVGLLDKLMRLVGELVLGRNQLLQITGQMDNGALHAATQRLNLITTELQEGVMKTRMQPIGNVWSKFPRVVRDLALALGKQVTLEMEGAETELDKTIIEAIKDPLTHIVRNSVDHGIEVPGVREAAGKSATGRLRLRAYHEGGQVNIEIAEDGHGIDTHRVKAKALERGLITQEQAATLTERELQQLIFLPGFSTAEKVTNVSGRGVGMDVVRTNIERIGGTIDLLSVLGQGTTLRIKIPLTLAIIPALTVTAGGARYCIPQVNLVELLRLDASDGLGVEEVLGAQVYRRRGQLLPLCSLNQELGLGPTSTVGGGQLVVLQADGRQFGLMVDGIHDTEEIVVKPLGTHMAGVKTYAGATILGDGCVALILDVMGLAERANVLAETREGSSRAAAAVEGVKATAPTRLIICGAGDRRVAFPLARVARLEDVKADDIESLAGHEVLQYRGELLPLVRLGTLIGAYGGGEELTQWPTVVYNFGNLQVGLMVDRIVDVVEDGGQVFRPVEAHGVAGASVINNEVTDLIDLNVLLEAHCGWLAETFEADATPALVPA
jgi:two-component system chemotaxis sensor kinase CheA